MRVHRVHAPHRILELTAMSPNDKDQRLKLAVQKSGRLTDPSLELLKSCGLKISRGRDDNKAVSN